MSRNIADWERWASIATGVGLLLLPGGRNRNAGMAAKALGAGLMLRGATGYCPVYQLADVDRSNSDTRRALGGSAGVNVAHAVTINRPASEVYGFWRNLENLPRVMTHLESVRVSGAGRSHWIARGPAGMSVSWDAETINQIDDKLIAWRSVEGSDIVNAGSVNFRKAPGGRGTEVRVSLQYSPPAGKLGAAIAWLFGEAGEQQIREDLRRLKQHLESSEISNSPQPTADHSSFTAARSL